MAEVLQLPGEWQLDASEKKFQGVLFVDREARSVCLKFWFYGESPKEVEPLPADFVCETVTGKLLSGKHITLLSCVGRLMRFANEPRSPHCTSEYHIEAKYAFVNVVVGQKSELSFPGALVDYGDIGEWSAVSAVSYEMDSRKANEYDWHLKANFGFQIWLRQDAFVSFSAHLKGGRCFDRRSQVVIEQPTRVQLCYAQGQSWNRIVNDIDIIHDLIEFGLDRYVPIVRIQTIHDSMLPDNLRGRQCFVSSYLEDVYLGTKRREYPQRNASDRITMMLPDLLPVLRYDSPDGWKRLLIVRPALKLFVEAHIYTDKIHSEKVFINLARAIEAVHRGLDLLKGGTGKQVCLATRLRNLLMPFWNIHDGGFENDDFEKIIQRVKKTRNYYTHYDLEDYAESLHDEQLAALNQKLIKMVRYYLLKMLGMPEDVVVRRFGYDVAEQCQIANGTYSWKLDKQGENFNGGADMVE